MYLKDQYQLKETFPYLLQALAISIGLSTFLTAPGIAFGCEKLAFIATSFSFTRFF